jgi:hypothetical protein
MKKQKRISEFSKHLDFHRLKNSWSEAIHSILVILGLVPKIRPGVLFRTRKRIPELRIILTARHIRVVVNLYVLEAHLLNEIKSEAGSHLEFRILEFIIVYFKLFSL